MRVISLALVVCTAGAVTWARPSPSEPFADFRRRVEQYVKLREGVENKLPTLKDRTSPERIIAHERALAEAIRTARAGVPAGSIITPAAKKEFSRVLAAALKGPGNKEARVTAKTGNPEFPTSTDPEAKEIKLALNAAYPKNAPVSTMPPSVLLKLPKLPDNLEYRFVGRDLIIRDITANIIVDYATGVAPL